MTEAKDSRHAQVQGINTRGRKLPPAPPVSQSNGGKPPGSSWSNRHKAE